MELSRDPADFIAVKPAPMSGIVIDPELVVAKQHGERKMSTEWKNGKRRGQTEDASF